jgi:hypothetical protein
VERLAAAVVKWNRGLHGFNRVGDEYERFASLPAMLCGKELTYDLVAQRRMALVASGPITGIA